MKRLKRYPFHPRDPLQAWDSSDELMIDHLKGLHQLGEGLKGQRLLILNDHFGTLACAVLDLENPPEITSYTDSYVNAKGAEINSSGRVHSVNRLSELKRPYDLAILQVPKNLSFFEDQLCHLSEHLKPGTKLICGYMVKHQANSAFELIQKIIGPTTTSLARKKARLIFSELRKSPTASRYPLRVSLDGFEKPFIHHSNLFSREKLDIGTRFLLGHIPTGDFKKILDLGCANGIIGIAAKRANPAAQILFTDESEMAIQSARLNFEQYFPDRAGDAEYHWTNAFEAQPADQLDLVICNPPFHQANTLSNHIAWQMFKDSHHALRPGGKIRVIGNTHLMHQVALKKIFGNSAVIAKDAKFMIIDATK